MICRFVKFNVAVMIILTSWQTTIAGLVCYWNFNGTPLGDGSLYLIDTVGDADGVLLNGAEYVTSLAGQAGLGMGNAVKFDEVDDYIVLQCSPVEDLNFYRGDFTISGWFKIDSVTSEDYFHTILDNSVHDYGGYFIWVGPANKSYAGKLGFDVKGFFGNVSIVSDGRVDDDIWHWMAIVCDKGELRMYIDGIIQEYTASYKPSTTATPPVNAVTIIGNKLGGQLDEFRLYNTALDGVVNNRELVAGQLYELWQVSNQTLVAYWHFDHGYKETTLLDVIDIANAKMANGATFRASTAGVNEEGFGNAGAFDFFDDLACFKYSFPNAFDLRREDLTITGWFKVDSVVSEPSYHMLLDAGVYNAGGIDIWLAPDGVSSAGKLGVEVHGMNAGIVSVMSNSRLDDDNWHWFAVVVKDEQLNLYVDGIKQESAADYNSGTTATPPVNIAISIGHLLGGQLDEIRIYKSALTVELSGTSGCEIIGGQLYQNWISLPEFVSCLQMIESGSISDGDINKDCTVDIDDLSIFLENWLKCNDPQIEGCENFN